MRRTLIPAAASLLIIASLAGAQAVQPRPSSQMLRGWRMATWGMTPPEVMTAFNGEARQLDKADDYGPRLIAPIGIDGFEIDGLPLKVRFQFRRDSLRLAQVLLQKYEDKDFVPSRATFVKLAQLLTEKYGPPTFQDTDVDKAIKSWAFPETVIELSYSHIRGIVQTTSLIYRPVDPKLRSLY